MPLYFVDPHACLFEPYRFVLSQNADEHEGGETCDTPDNYFTPANVTAQLPNGQRIDYVFYRANAGMPLSRSLYPLLSPLFDHQQREAK